MSHKSSGGGSARIAVPDTQVLTQIIVDGNVETLVAWADKLGYGLARTERLTTTQMRGFFGEVRQLQSLVESQEAPADAAGSAPSDPAQLNDSIHRKLILLKPKLAYQAQRDKENRKGEGVLRLSEVLTPAIDLIERDPQRFRRFVEFFEAILAYHKAAGGKES